MASFSLRQYVAMGATVITAKPFRLMCIKQSGARVEFSRYATRLEAEQIGARLGELGCKSDIEESRYSPVAESIG